MLVLLASLLLVGVTSLLLGAGDVGPLDAWSVLTGGGSDEARFVVESLRLPRTLIGVAVGMALGVAEQLPAKLVEGAAVVKAGQLVFQGCGPGLLVSLLEFQFHLLAPGDIGGNFQSHQPAVGVHIQQFVGLEVGNVNQGIKVIEYSLKPGRRCGPGGRKASAITAQIASIP